MSSDKKPLVELWPVGNIIPYELNVKKHDREQVSRIVQSIQRFGWADGQAIIVNRDGVILAGHGRRLAALELGMSHVKVCQVTHMTPEQERAFRLADNRAAVSDIDSDMLRVELGSLLGFEEDLSGIFDAKELDFAVADLGTMNMDAFVSDMGAVLDEQKRDMAERSERVAGEGVRMPLARAFGFKDIAAGEALHIAALMARAEATTGLKGDAALVAFAKNLTETAS